MKLWKFNNYEEYKDAQLVGYSAKVNTHSWVDTYSVRGIVSYIFDCNPEVSFGLCHGTRRGVEQEEFNKTFDRLGLNVTVIGTEIADEAQDRFPNTIEWDFHEVKDEWINSVNFIYSNSFDHSYKPKECLDSWMSCLSPNGIAIIEWTDCDINPRPMDPTGGTVDEYKVMINDKYDLVDVLENDPSADSGKDYKGKRFFFIVKNRNQ